MDFSTRFERVFRTLLPSPLSIALALTCVSFLLAWLFTESKTDSFHFVELAGYWSKGLWDGPMLIFLVQMMLILVLGHVIALSPPASLFIDKLTGRLRNTADAAAWISFFTMVVSFFNWGLGLIFGAILARKMAESAQKRGLKMNYPVLGAAGYVGLMVWHGGLSGSAPLKANEAGHLHAMMQGVIGFSPATLPQNVPMEDTILSNMNLTAAFLLLSLVPLSFYLMGKYFKPLPIELNTPNSNQPEGINSYGAEKLDESRLFGRLFAGLLLFYAMYEAMETYSEVGLAFITPNYINGILLGLGLLLHSSLRSFGRAVDEAIGDAAGILIQFPLYFGIMGLMRNSGLVDQIAGFFTTISSTDTFPVFTFISSGIINIFVPSGGGQWSIQAPILIQASEQLGVPLSKSIMAMAYGDQLTNMLQPFWALPLLGITGLKAREILPFSLLVMLLGALIFTGVLIFL